MNTMIDNILGINIRTNTDGTYESDSQDIPKMNDIIHKVYLKLQSSDINISKNGIYVLEVLTTCKESAVKCIKSSLIFGKPVLIKNGDKKVEYSLRIKTGKVIGYRIFNNTDKLFFGTLPHSDKLITLGQVESLIEQMKVLNIESINFNIDNDKYLELNEIVPEHIITDEQGKIIAKGYEQLDKIIQSEKTYDIKIIASITYRDNIIGYVIDIEDVKINITRNRKVYCEGKKLVENFQQTITKEQVLNKKETVNLLKQIKLASCKVKFNFINFKVKTVYGNLSIQTDGTVHEIVCNNTQKEFMNFIKSCKCSGIDKNLLDKVYYSLYTFGDYLPTKYFKN